MREEQDSEEAHRHAIRHWSAKDAWHKPILCNLVVNLSRFVMRRMNTLNFVHRERWEAAMADRSRGILSFSNHVALFDDPLLISNLSSTRYNDVRWIGADHKNFFGNALKGFIYSAGKCVPLIRGAGLEQPGFEFLIERLKANEWVHLFPEGGRTREQGARLRTPFKRGIGRLMADARPLMLPFYHLGMEGILPIGKALPRSGQNVTVYFGRSTLLDDAWWETYAQGETDSNTLWTTLTNWSQQELEQLQEEALSYSGGLRKPVP